MHSTPHRERRRLRQQHKKLKERLVKNRSANDEAGEIVRQEHLFRLRDIKSQAQLEEVDRGEMAELEGKRCMGNALGWHFVKRA